MSSPTTEQLEIAKKNIKTMRDFNEYTFIHGTPYISNAFYLLTEPPNDAGLTYVLDFFSLAFSTLASFAGPAAEFAAGFLEGMLSSWASDPPPSLNKQFADITTRFNKTSVEIDLTLAKVHDGLEDPGTRQATWDSEYKLRGKSYKVSDLAASLLPDKDTAIFVDNAKKAEKEWDRRIWRLLLVANYRIPYRDRFRTDYTDKNVPPIPWIKEQIGEYPYAYFSYFWHQGNGGDCSLWIAVEYCLELNATGFRDLSDDACAYLFIDSVPGTIINKDGLFTREEVVKFMGIKIVTNDIERAKAYREAEKEGKTLLALYQAHGREAIERQVIEKVQTDPVFARKLTRDTKETLEAFFDIKIPEHVNLTVVIEDPMSFGLVIPAKASA